MLVLVHPDIQRAAPHQVSRNMREIVHIQAGQCGNQIGAKVGTTTYHNRPPLSFTDTMEAVEEVRVTTSITSILYCQCRALRYHQRFSLSLSLSQSSLSVPPSLSPLK